MKNHQRKQRIALIYDFDGTLSPGNIQEYDFIPKLKVNSSSFWNKVKERAKESNSDEILSYMSLMLEEANHSKIKVTQKSFMDYGKKVELFNGLDTWFSRVNSYIKERNCIPHHFIISSGIREMIKGTKIQKEFSEIYACSFICDHHGVAKWPGLAVNYTTKTQFLYRINKGVLNVWDNTKINDYIPKKERHIPFENMIYIGDGATDVPCMCLVRDNGGFSIAVYKPNTKLKSDAKKLVSNNRVHKLVPADYSKGKKIEKIVYSIVDIITNKEILNKI